MAFAARISNEFNLDIYTAYRQLVRALHGETAALGDWTGCGFDEERHAAETMARLPAMLTFYPAALAHVLQALAQSMHGADEERQAALLARFDASRDWLAARAADAPANFHHLLRWLEAERAWATGGAASATAAFDAALAAADGSQCP